MRERVRNERTWNSVTFVQLISTNTNRIGLRQHHHPKEQRDHGSELYSTTKVITMGIIARTRGPVVGIISRGVRRRRGCVIFGGRGRILLSFSSSFSVVIIPNTEPESVW